MKIFIISLLLVLLRMFTPEPGQAQPGTSGNKDTLVVGIKETPPFIIKNPQGQFSGLSIRLWENMAQTLDMPYRYKEMTLEELLSGLADNQIDICINPLSVTSERIKNIDFSQPFYITNLAIATNKSFQENTILKFIFNLFSWDFFKAVGLLFLTLLAFGFVAWLFERKHNSQEFEKGLKGIWSGIWWSAVTMTTVGYGDKTPKTTGGRLIGLIWMFAAIIVVSGFTASIASSLTVNQLSSTINGTSALKNFETGALQNSTSAHYLTSQNIPYQSFETADKALEYLSRGEIETLVYDEPLLRYMILDKGLSDRVSVLPYTFNKQYYSFAFPKNSQLPDQVNPILLNQINSIEWKAVTSEYGMEN